MKTFLLLVGAIFAVTGCTSYESTRGAHSAREYLTADIEDQIVFNLIRGQNGLPFAHYDVSQVQSIVTSKITPQVGGSRTGVSSGFQPGVIATSAVHMVTRVFNAGVSAERDNAVTVNVAPVFDDPKIYQSYVHYLNLPVKSVGDYSRSKESESEKPSKEMPRTVTTTEIKDKDGKPAGSVKETNAEVEAPPPSPELLQIEFKKPTSENQVASLMKVSAEPAKGTYIPHTCRKWEDRWYYIPVEYTADFSDLCLSLVARKTRGSASTGAAGSKSDATAKALEQLNSQLMQKNSLDLSR